MDDTPSDLHEIDDPFRAARAKADAPEGPDLIYGAAAIKRFLVEELGMPGTTDPYYLQRTRKWPIFKDGFYLVGSRRRLGRHARKIGGGG